MAKPSKAKIFLYHAFIIPLNTTKNTLFIIYFFPIFPLLYMIFSSLSFLFLSSFSLILFFSTSIILTLFSLISTIDQTHLFVGKIFSAPASPLMPGNLVFYPNRRPLFLLSSDKSHPYTINHFWVACSVIGGYCHNHPLPSSPAETPA